MNPAPITGLKWHPNHPSPTVSDESTFRRAIEPGVS